MRLGSDVWGSRPGKRDRLPGPGCYGSVQFDPGRRGSDQSLDGEASRFGDVVAGRLAPQQRASRVVRAAVKVSSSFRVPRLSPEAELANHCMQQTNARRSSGR